MSVTRTFPVAVSSRPTLYLELTKPDVTFLVVLSTLAGFWMGSPGALNIALLFHALIGTTVVAAGTAALNHYFERATDAKMRRTAQRPLPTGLLRPTEVVLFGSALVLFGGLYLLLLVNALACLLALATTFSYLGAYTPLKKRSTWSTFVGSFPGAVPPLIGWAAATGTLSAGAWILYAILFFWQFPHFLAIAWMYREDYARGGIQMLPVVDKTGAATYRQILACTAATLLATLLPTVAGMAGIRYFFGALVLGMLFTQVAIWAWREKTNARARWLMHASVIYLPLVLGLMMYDRTAR